MFEGITEEFDKVIGLIEELDKVIGELHKRKPIQHEGKPLTTGRPKFKGAGPTNPGANVKTEREYALWLKEMYGDLPQRFPPSSVVCFDDDELHEFVVVGYADFGDKHTFSVIDMKHRGCRYEDFPTYRQEICPNDLPRIKFLYSLNGSSFVKQWEGYFA